MSSRLPNIAPPARCEPLEPRCLLATNGLSAVYFNNRDFTGATRSRVDTHVAFDWPDHGRPTAGIRGTTFAVRWTGLVKPRTNEVYTFLTRNNDAVRLWVNGKLLFESWHNSKRANHSGTISLKANRLYDLRLEYFTGYRTAAIHLFWSTPSRAQEIVPNSRLFAYDTRSGNIGDYGRDSQGEADVTKLIRSWKPHFITTTGDNNYTSGSASTIDRNIGKYFFDFIGNYKGTYGEGPNVNLFFPALGNHDWDSAQGAQPYLNYFTLPGNERYYDFVQGPIHFFVIDSDTREPDGITASSKQGQWLKGKLAASTSPFDIVIGHHPPYTSGSHGSTTALRWPFREWGADALLTGHVHLYERLNIDEIPYITNGAGATLHEFTNILPQSVVRDSSDLGALLIQANEFALTMQYQLRSGKIVDTITIGPEPPPLAAAAPAAISSMSARPNLFSTAPILTPVTPALFSSGDPERATDDSFVS